MGAGSEFGGSEQVDIDVADSQTKQAVRLDHAHDFFMGGDRRLRKSIKRAQYTLTIFQAANGNFTDDERMHHDLIGEQQGSQLIVSFT